MLYVVPCGIDNLREIAVMDISHNKKQTTDCHIHLNWSAYIVNYAFINDKQVEIILLFIIASYNSRKGTSVSFLDSRPQGCLLVQGPGKDKYGNIQCCQIKL